MRQIDDAAGLIGTLEVYTQLHEGPDIGPGQRRGVLDSAELKRRAHRQLTDFAVPVRISVPNLLQIKPQRIHFEPHLFGDLIAHRPRILPRESDTIDDAVRILPRTDHVGHDILVGVLIPHRSDFEERMPGVLAGER